MNRYHNPGTGRFMTPDPYMNSAGPTDPGSWNRYAYTRGDPVNRLDPNGTCDSVVDGVIENPCEYGPVDLLSNFCVWGFFEPGDDASACSGGGPSYYAGPPGGGGQGGGASPPPTITLREIDDCIYSKGTSILPGAWTLEVEYQVLVNGLPVYGNDALNSLGISISESVTTTSGHQIRGGGTWCPVGSVKCRTSGSMSPSGTFWDVLAGGPSTADQTFLFNGQPISVSFSGVSGSQTVLKNTYNSPGHSISVGNGALTGNSATRPCGKNGDPE